MPILSVTHIMPVLSGGWGVGMQQCMIRNQNEMHKLSKVRNGRKYTAKTVLGHFSLTRSPPELSLTVSKIPDISLTAVKIPDISRFSRQVVALFTM